MNNRQLTININPKEILGSIDKMNTYKQASQRRQFGKDIILKIVGDFETVDRIVQCGDNIIYKDTKKTFGSHPRNNPMARALTLIYKETLAFEKRQIRGETAKDGSKLHRLLRKLWAKTFNFRFQLIKVLLK